MDLLVLKSSKNEGFIFCKYGKISAIVQCALQHSELMSARRQNTLKVAAFFSKWLRGAVSCSVHQVLCLCVFGLGYKWFLIYSFTLHIDVSDSDLSVCPCWAALICCQIFCHCFSDHFPFST